MNTNPLPNHAISSGTINILKNRGLRTLKVFMDEIYEMLVKVWFRKGSCENGPISKSFYMYH